MSYSTAGGTEGKWASEESQKLRTAPAALSHSNKFSLATTMTELAQLP